MPQIDLASYYPSIFVFFILWTVLYILLLVFISLRLVNPYKLVLKKKKTIYWLFFF